MINRHWKGNEDSRDNEYNWMMMFTFIIPDLGLNIQVEQDTSRTWWRSFVEINLMENNRLCTEINLFMFATFNLEPRNVYVSIASLLWMKRCVIFSTFKQFFYGVFLLLNKCNILFLHKNHPTSGFKNWRIYLVLLHMFLISKIKHN